MSCLELSAKMLVAAIITLVAGGILIFNMEGSEAAISAIGGVFIGPAPDATARFALVIDFLFPAFYGAGLILLAIGLKSGAVEENRDASLIVSIVCGLLVVAVVADYVENGLAMSALAGKDGMGEQPSPATLVKYGLIAMSGPLISILVPGRDGFSRTICWMLRYLVPVSLIVSATHAFPFLAKLTPLSFILFLGALAVYARREAGEKRL